MSIDYSGVKSYQMYLNYDNDKQVYVLPVLPDDIKITYAGETTSVKIDRFGEVLHKGKRSAAVIRFSSYFPVSWDPYYCSCPKDKFRSPAAWDRWLKALEEAKKPCHLVLTKSPVNLNIYADVTSYTATEQGGDPGTIYYDLELKEHRDPVIRILHKTSGNVSGSSSDNRINNQADTNTYKVACSALNLRTAPNATIIETMQRNEIVTSDGKTDGNWLHVLYKEKWGYAYSTYLVQC